MTPTITAFESSPDRGRGLARDMAVRWALEEVGQPYDVRLVTFEAMKQPAHLAHQPFGQIPTYEEGDLSLFESGAIVLHITEHHAGLFPGDANARARAIAWMFAALTTVQGPVVEREAFILMEKDKSWFKERLPILDERVRARLSQLADRLGARRFAIAAARTLGIRFPTEPPGQTEAHADVPPDEAAYQKGLCPSRCIAGASLPGRSASSSSAC